MRFAFSRLVDQKRIGDLEMAKRISNSCDHLGKNFESVFVKKNFTNIFETKKISTEIPEPQKKFQKNPGSTHFLIRVDIRCLGE